MKKFSVAAAFALIVLLGFCGLSSADSMSGEVVSLDLDVKAMTLKVKNPFTQKEIPTRFVWVAGSSEGAVLKDLKPGDRIRVRADKDVFGRYLVKKVVRA